MIKYGAYKIRSASIWKAKLELQVHQKTNLELPEHQKTKLELPEHQKQN